MVDHNAKASAGRVNVVVQLSGGVQISEERGVNDAILEVIEGCALGIRECEFRASSEVLSSLTVD